LQTLGDLRPLRSPLRYLLVVAAAVAAAAHIPVTGEHLHEAPYMGVLFILLTVACSVLALAALVRDVPAVYAAAATVCGLAIIGYAATRVVAFPMLADDVGNWLEPLGVVSIVAETVVVASALASLRGYAAVSSRSRATSRSGSRPFSTKA
jgi:hypothetical protein